MIPTKRTPNPAPEHGVHRGIPFDEYASWDALNASTISRFLASPKAGAWYLQEEPEPPTPAMQLGSALHAAVLEPDDYAKRAIQTDIGPTAVEGYKDFKAEHPDAIILRKGWGELIERIADELNAHPRASKILGEPNSDRELTIVWSEKIKYNNKVVEIPCKARLDLFSTMVGAVVDLKKLRKDAGMPDQFMKAIWNYGYYLQAAWYARAAQRGGLSKSRPAYAWICVEETPPHEIDLYQADDAMMRTGWNDCMVGLQRYAQYRISGEALGRSNRIEEISLPAWAKEGVK